MINEADDHPHPRPDHERERSSKSFLPIIVVILVVYFSLSYRPNHPTVAVTAVELPYYTLSLGGSTVSFTFTFYATVTNPTNGVFSYSTTYSHLFYAGQHVGYMSIPGRHIAPSEENFMKVSMSVKALPVSEARYIPALYYGIINKNPTMELELYMKIVGRVTSYWLFTRQVERVIDCNVTVSISHGSLLAADCFPFAASLLS